jgi:hypothetical protein
MSMVTMFIQRMTYGLLEFGHPIFGQTCRRRETSKIDQPFFKISKDLFNTWRYMATVNIWFLWTQRIFLLPFFLSFGSATQTGEIPKYHRFCLKEYSSQKTWIYVCLNKSFKSADILLRVNKNVLTRTLATILYFLFR